MQPPVCLTCGVVSADDLRNKPALARLQEWQGRLALFWGRYPVLLRGLAFAPAFLLGAAVVAAYFGPLRRASLPLLCAAMLLYVAREYYPLAPLPFNADSVVTSRHGPFAAALAVAIRAALFTVTAGLLVTLAERLGLAAATLRGNGERGARFWSDFGTHSGSPWPIAFTVVVSLAYAGAMAVHVLAHHTRIAIPLRLA
mmetsp:Transcript_16002/g.45267  ORF Transcript_16002/g.45267 Transcript_16002/m.45267 type:complete len:199 (-) Transcript_16002:811-1407(-)